MDRKTKKGTCKVCNPTRTTRLDTQSKRLWEQLKERCGASQALESTFINSAMQNYWNIGFTMEDSLQIVQETKIIREWNLFKSPYGKKTLAREISPWTSTVQLSNQCNLGVRSWRISLGTPLNAPCVLDAWSSTLVSKFVKRPFPSYQIPYSSYKFIILFDHFNSSASIFQ